MCVTCKSMYREQKSLSLGLSQDVYWMRVCSCITLSVILEKYPFNITHSRLEIEWCTLLKCTAI